MIAILDTVHDYAAQIPTVLADIPNPGQGELPPGVGPKLLMLLRWVAGIAVVACVGGIIYVGAKLGIAYQNGHSSNVGKLGMVLAGCLLVGSASTLAAVLI